MFRDASLLSLEAEAILPGQTVLVADERIAQMARETRDVGVWIAPTNTMIANVALFDPSVEDLAARPEMAYLPPDLVLLADNPLEDVGAASRPLGVMVRGRWLDRDALDAGLATFADRYR